jgi:TRAP-type C4-dicarboxylate transport system permease small subunit
MPTTERSNVISRIIQSISRGMGFIAICVLVAMMLLTVLDVFLRRVFNSPIPFSLELVEFMMVLTGFLGLAWCAMSESHIRVDLIVSKMPARVRGIIDSLCYLAGLGISGIIAWRSVMECQAIRKLHTQSAVLGIPIYPFYLVVAAGFAALALAILILLVRSLKEAVKG